MGPAITKTHTSHHSYRKVRQRGVLYRAWSVVRDNGSRSSSHSTRDELKKFAQKAVTHLDRIQRDLLQEKFVFKPARGVLLKKKDKKSKRPVVIAPVESRIVQRALLDVIQGIPAIRAQLYAGYNFGGIEGEEYGVPGAVQKALATSQQKAYYIRTDIKSFFTAVPRELAVHRIISHISDPKFNSLLKAATETELKDMESFGEEAKLFPLAEEGVAQGSCLSPLLCNLLLADFDREMNDRDVVCIRYIDDFIIFAPDKSTAFSAFRSALKKLHALGLDAYDPESSDMEEKKKADHGPVSAGFVFLGCEIRPDRVRPSKDNWRKLIKKIKEIFDETLETTGSPESAVKSDRNYANAVQIAGDTVRGWGNTYSFCTDDRLMINIDQEIEKLFFSFNSEFKKRTMSLSKLDRRRVAGFFPLVDCNKDSDDAGVRALVRTYKMLPSTSK